MEALVADLVSSVTSLQDSISQLRADNGTLRESVSQLLTDNGTLRKSVSQLQEEVKAQKRASDSNQTQLAILQKNNGVLFPKFGQLPIELQRIVWVHACQTPQTHVVQNCGCVSRSQISSIMKTCKEARTTATLLHLDYFVVNSDELFPMIPGLIKIYVNLAIDTFWLTQRNWPHVSLPNEFEWHCGKCEHDVRGEDHMIDDDFDWPAVMRRLAVNIDNWRTATEQQPERVLGILGIYNLEELLLVVGDSSYLQREKSVIFVTPADLPENTSNGMVLADAHGGSHSTVTWKEIAGNVRRFLEDLKEERLALQEDDNFDEDGYEIFVEKDFQIPTIRVVEAIKEPSRWVLSAPAIRDD